VFACVERTLPLAVRENRLETAFFVFIFGMSFPFVMYKEFPLMVMLYEPLRWGVALYVIFQNIARIMFL